MPSQITKLIELLALICDSEHCVSETFDVQVWWELVDIVFPGGKETETNHRSEMQHPVSLAICPFSKITEIGNKCYELTNVKFGGAPESVRVYANGTVKKGGRSGMARKVPRPRSDSGRTN